MEYYVNLSDSTLAKLEEAISGEEIDVVELHVTENDTYIAPEGKAYSPVVVEVEDGSLEDVYKPILTLTINNPDTLTLSLTYWKIVSNSVVYEYNKETSDSEIILAQPIFGYVDGDDVVFEVPLDELISLYGVDIEGSVSNLVNTSVEDTVLTITDPTKNASATVTVTAGGK